MVAAMKSMKAAKAAAVASKAKKAMKTMKTATPMKAKQVKPLKAMKSMKTATPMKAMKAMTASSSSSSSGPSTAAVRRLIAEAKERREAAEEHVGGLSGQLYLAREALRTAQLAEEAAVNIGAHQRHEAEMEEEAEEWAAHHHRQFLVGTVDPNPPDWDSTGFFGGLFGHPGTPSPPPMP
jgi:hypothetical protein